MRIIDPRLLRDFARAGHCECCGKWCRQREAHHVYTRGSGRLDIRMNLVSLGSTKLNLCACHRQADKIGREAFLVIIAQREGMSVEAIVEEVQRLRRLSQPRDGGPESPLVKRKKKRSAWAEKAGQLRRAYARAAYRKAKEFRKSKGLNNEQIKRGRKIGSIGGDYGEGTQESSREADQERG